MTDGSTDQRRLLLKRSASQLLDRRSTAGPDAAVRSLLAVQAQDRTAWRLSLRARVEGITAADVDQSLSDRRLLVAWLNRGTLHLVASEDFAWLWALTAPTQVVSNARRLVQEGLTPEDVDRAVVYVARALADEGPLVRGQIRERLAAQGIRTDGQATVQLLFAIVNRGVAVQGPAMPGGHAFVHSGEWLGAVPKPLLGEARERALAELARRYLIGHAPATEGDLAKWAGLPLRDARTGLRAIGAELVEYAGGLVELAARRPRSSAEFETPLPPRLLPAFDPCLLGWREREPFLRRADEAAAIPPGGGLFRPVATVDGVAAATWGVARKGPGLDIHVEPFRPLAPDAREALHAEAHDVARFEGRTLGGVVGLE